jgi:mRNA interferase RelE/StbE
MKTAFKESFLKAILKIKDHKLKSEIAAVISFTETAEDFRKIPNLKKLHGQGKYYRIKVGDYRIGLKLVDDVLYFVDLAHRKDIYKHFP